MYQTTDHFLDILPGAVVIFLLVASSLVFAPGRISKTAAVILTAANIITTNCFFLPLLLQRCIVLSLVFVSLFVMPCGIIKRDLLGLFVW